MKTMHLFRYVPVWRRNESGLSLYRCLEALGGNGFTVQSRDFFTADSIKERVPMLEAQFIELLLEESPDDCFPLHDSLEAAIEAFDADFGDVSRA